MNINFLHRPDFHKGLLCHRWAPATRFHLCVRWQICLWKFYLSFNVSIHALSIFSSCQHCHYGPLTRYTKLRVAHGPGILGTGSPSQRVSDPDMHQGTCVSHVPWCMLGSLTSSFVWHCGENNPGIPGACTTRNFPKGSMNAKSVHLPGHQNEWQAA